MNFSVFVLRCEICYGKQACDGSWAEQELFGNRSASDDCMDLTAGFVLFPLLPQLPPNRMRTSAAIMEAATSRALPWGGLYRMGMCFFLIFFAQIICCFMSDLKLTRITFWVSEFSRERICGEVS